MFFFLLGTGSQGVFSQEPVSGKELVEMLRQGGYNIYFRHAATDWSKDDHVAVNGDWTSCDPEKMRQLSAEGRSVAQRIGQSIRDLGIPYWAGVFQRILPDPGNRPAHGSRPGPADD